MLQPLQLVALAGCPKIRLLQREQQKKWLPEKWPHVLELHKEMLPEKRLQKLELHKEKLPEKRLHKLELHKEKLLA